MSFDRDGLARALALGPVARVVIAEAKGSVPRGVGTAMLIRQDGQSGTIGGGALEWEAARLARAALLAGEDRLERMPLGPGLGQCCGGAVTLLIEVWDRARLTALGEEDVVARPLPGGPREMPLAVSRAVARGRGGSDPVAPGMVGGWMIEPVSRSVMALWVWGAGHVGRAITGVLAPLPELRLTWIDTDAGRFPAEVPAGVETLVAARPADLVARAPRDAHHLILTYSHALDLELCHALLGHGFASAGLIGSKTKWARFRSRLQTLGHPPAEIARIDCPIGDPALGKHPQAIAIGVANAILARGSRGTSMGLTA